MLPWKIFENLHAVMAIVVLFEKFSPKFWSKFLTLILSALPNMMQFVCTFSFMRARRKTYCYERGSKLWKNCTGYIKNSFENG